MYRGMEWETGQQNADTNSARLQYDKLINDVSKSTQLSIESIKGIIQAIIVGAMRR